MAWENLSCNSVEGAQSRADERVAAKMFMAQFPGYVYQHTPKAAPADIDAVLTRNNEIIRVIETKCRYGFDLQTFETKWQSKWLVSHDKVVRSMAVAKALRVGLTFFLYVADEKTLLVQKITDAHGFIKVDFGVAASQTFKNLYKDKSKWENNAFIDMSRAQRITSLAGDSNEND